MEVPVNALVGIILSYITVSNQCAAQPKLTHVICQLYLNKVEEKIIKKERKLSISCIFGTHQKPRGTCSTAANSSAT